jgi:transcriptional regulator with XRE-family HTH domain
VSRALGIPNTNILAYSCADVKAPLRGAMAKLFGEKLRYLRHEHQLTQVALAEQLEIVAQPHIANLEAGRDIPSLVLVVKVSNLFKVSTDYLLRDTIPVESGEAYTLEYQSNLTRSASSFGAKLRALRLQHRLTQVELSSQLGLSRQGYISNLEAGRKAPSLDLIVQIADAFATSTDNLLQNIDTSS